MLTHHGSDTAVRQINYKTDIYNHKDTLVILNANSAYSHHRKTHRMSWVHDHDLTPTTNIYSQLQGRTARGNNRKGTMPKCTVDRSTLCKRVQSMHCTLSIHKKSSGHCSWSIPSGPFPINYNILYHCHCAWS